MDIEDELEKVRVTGPDPALRQRILDAAEEARQARPLRLSRRWRLALAIAASLLIAGGAFWIVQANRVPVTPPLPVPAPNDIAGAPAVEILDGRGRVVPLGDDTRFTLVDAGRGRVRLERGQVYVELPTDAGLRAEVETPAGTASARGTSFYTHYTEGATAVPAFLAVAGQGGAVEVDTPGGRTVCDAGAVVLAPAGAPPCRHADPARTAHESITGCPFASALGLVYRADVQAELRLTAEQKARLQRPGVNELEATCRFFRGLRTVPPDQWAQTASAFCAAQWDRASAVLDATQRRRFREIGLQQEGLFALGRSEVADELGLTPPQREHIVAALKGFGTGFRALTARGLPKAERAREIDALRSRAEAEITAALTETQRATWRQMLGEPFALAPTHHP